MKRLKDLRTALVGLVAAGALTVGAWTAWPGNRTVIELCTLEPPCDDCMQQCMAANYPNGGDCNEMEDCCVCFER